jgi:hypothetical protein
MARNMTLDEVSLSCAVGLRRACAFGSPQIERWYATFLHVISYTPMPDDILKFQIIVSALIITCNGILV